MGRVVSASLRDEAEAAYDSGDFAQAYALFLPLAEQGDYGARLSVASMLYDGRGVPQDHAESARWFRLILEVGDCGYSRGLLGNIEETEKSRRRAYDGDADGQHRLGMAYRAGWGVPADLVQAHMWASMAAEQGHERALSLREIFGRQMKPEQLAESGRLLKQWRRRKSG